MDKDRFIAIRRAKSFTQAEFAAALGVSPGYVGDIERGHRDVSLNVAVKLEALTQQPVVAEYVAARAGRG